MVVLGTVVGFLFVGAGGWFVYGFEASAALLNINIIHFYPLFP